MFFGKSAIKSDIYKEGVKILCDEMANENFIVNVKERLEKAICIIDESIEQLIYEEINNPYKILGFTMNYGFIQAVATGIVSVGIASFQRIMNQS